MKTRNIHIIIVMILLPAFINSCLKESNCTYNVFEEEALYMNVVVDDSLFQLDNSEEDYIYPTLRYQVDTSRQDTLIFLFVCNYLFNEGKEAISLTVMKYADFSDVYNMGGGILNYADFDSLNFSGQYDYIKRESYIPDHAVDIRYFVNDSLVYYVDTSPDNPEDFYFNADNFVPGSDTDCYGRNFKWFAYNGNFGCRLVEPKTGDTIVIKDGEFRGVMMQFSFSSY